jgi:monoamine oxidase
MHWAGTETAGTSYGSIDGAVRSGERAAADVLQLLDEGGVVQRDVLGSVTPG